MSTQTQNTPTSGKIAAPLTSEEASVVKPAIEPGVVIRPVATVENLDHARQDAAIAASARDEAQAILDARVQALNEFWASNNGTDRALRDEVLAAVKRIQQHRAAANGTQAILIEGIDESSHNVSTKAQIAASATRVERTIQLALDAQTADATQDAQLAEIHAREAEALAQIQAAQDNLAALRRNASQVIQHTEGVKVDARKAQADLANDPAIATVLNIDRDKVILDTNGVLQVRDDAAARAAALEGQAAEMTEELLNNADALGMVLGQAQDASRAVGIADGVLNNADPVAPADSATVDRAVFIDAQGVHAPVDSAAGLSGVIDDTDA